MQTHATFFLPLRGSAQNVCFSYRSRDHQLRCVTGHTILHVHDIRELVWCSKLIYYSFTSLSNMLDLLPPHIKLLGSKHNLSKSTAGGSSSADDLCKVKHAIMMVIKTLLQGLYHLLPSIIYF